MDSKRKYDYCNMLYKVNAITKSIWLIANIMASFVDTFRQTPKEPSSLWGGADQERPKWADNFLTRKVRGGSVY